MAILTKATCISMSLFCFTAMVQAAETNVMSCQLQNGREVKVTWEGNYLKYAYGKPGKSPELALPTVPGTLKDVHFGAVSFASSEAVYYRFSSGKYDYVTYFSERNDGTVSNLGVFKDKKLIKQIKCKDFFQTDLTNIYQPVSNNINQDASDESMDWVVNDGSDSEDTTPIPDESGQGTAPQSNIPPIKVTYSTDETRWDIPAGTDLKQYKTVIITSTKDNLIINDVIVNRGQCRRFAGNPSKPVALPFGASVTYKYLVYSYYYTFGTKFPCDIVEVVIKTNQGNWTYN